MASDTCLAGLENMRYGALAKREIFGFIFSLFSYAYCAYLSGDELC